ncbi:MAG TPA: redox-sensitive transcriptional activator SoxR [Ilumatobacteraceae bacterium]|nr:redox-sensitive transcriptional activator SoxR [Ilumatobacteraceae bacterium]
MVEVKTESRRTFTVGEVATRSGVATSALRFYEANALITSERTEAGHRRYHADVMRRVGFIKVAQRVGLSLEEIKAALDSLPSGRTPNRREWAKLASSWQPLLDERIAMLEAMKDKLDGCIGCGCLSLDTCALYNPGDVAAARGAGPRYLLGDTPST